MKIELRDVSKRFGSVTALDHLTLEVPSGAKVALVGPNGSGKSTLVRAVMGMLRCDGLVLLDGEDAFAHRARLASGMAYVPQAAPQLGASVGEVVRAVAEIRGLEPAEIRRVASGMALELDEIARRPVRALSGGTKQKLLITLALAAPAALLIMDEPTASLDARTRQAFFRQFRERSVGATLLLSSHRLEEVRRLVNRVVVLEDGRVALDAAVDSPEVAARLNGGALAGTEEPWNATREEECV